MRGTTPALVTILAVTLLGCPLPQPLPDYPPGTITPPRIVVDDSVSQIASPESVVRVPQDCAPGHEPLYALDAQIRDANTIEGIEVRWFVNYEPTAPGYNWVKQQAVTLTAPNDPTLRDIDPYTFPPYPYDGVKQRPGDLAEHVPGNAPGALHVVELVVSNGFHAGGVDAPVPNRSPAPGFEVQTYRWVFLNVPEPAGCTPGAPGCCR